MTDTNPDVNVRQADAETPETGLKQNATVSLTVEKREPADDGVSQTHPAEDVQPADTPDDTEGSGREAKLRKRARDAEAARDDLAAKLAALQRQQVESMLGTTLKPAALWSVTTLDDVLATDGTVDPDRLETAVRSARETLGINPVGGAPIPGVGNRPDNTPAADWKSAFAPQR